MQIGVFGKLPVKGDFVSRGVPAEVLQHWEVWLEKVVSGAKHHLGAQWHDVYGAAPAWRFWVGEMVYGHAFTGVLIPSMDRVGRRFPLTLVLTGANDRHPAPPLAGDGNAPFYDGLEEALKASLSDSFDGDLDRLLAGLPLPHGAVQARATDRRQAFFAYGEEGLTQMLGDVRDHDHQLAAVARSYWWTAGNAHVGPALVALNGMPDAAGFATLLAGFGPPTARADMAPPVTAATPEAQAAAWGDDPTSDHSWSEPASAAPAQPDSTGEDDPWANNAPSSSEEASPFATATGWAVPPVSALPERAEASDDPAAVTDAAPGPDSPAEAEITHTAPPAVPEASDDAPETPPAEPDLPPEAAQDDAPDQTEQGGDIPQNAPADTVTHSLENEDDHASPFGLPEDRAEGLGRKKGPSLRGLFSLKGRGTKAKD